MADSPKYAATSNPATQSNRLETWGNATTMNLNNLLYQNIQTSAYFKSLYAFKTYHEVMAEAKTKVDNLEPFLKGHMASSAFCLLLKFWTLRLTVKQVNGLLKNPDSPYVRALGFLYLRYVCQPSQLWDWYEPFLDDPEEVTLCCGPAPKVTTIGKLCVSLLKDMKFNGTILPRIPVPIARKIQEKLESRRESSSSSRSYDNRSDYSRRQRRSRSRSNSRSRYSRHYRGYRSRSRSVSRDRRHGSGRSYRRSYNESTRYKPSRSRSPYGRSRNRSRSRERGTTQGFPLGEEGEL
ncbi:hypothetical protein IWQ62_001061 [Dispira parvispora]|uniref:Pre-mRNA-splicing factor 38 n=1 Tax=Dispira parvispora TaxID=1520584 RepID=A0A9W8E8L2_9FUNG|nr:hypothetical protein IWQ62_001061 [Dispira parvispora]